jgi:hypothetical protein
MSLTNRMIEVVETKKAQLSDEIQGCDPTGHEVQVYCAEYVELTRIEQYLEERGAR